MNGKKTSGQVKTKVSPGPWERKGDGYEFYDVDANGDPVGLSDEDVRAILATPRTLELLRQCVERMTYHNGSPHGDLLRSAVALLAEIEGE